MEEAIRLNNQGRNIRYNEAYYNLDNIVIYDAVQDSDKFSQFLKWCLSNKIDPKDVLIELKQIIEDDVNNWYGYVSAGDDSFKYRRIKEAFKELMS